MSCLLINPTYSEKKKLESGEKERYVPMSIIKGRTGSGERMVSYEQDASDAKWAQEMEVKNQKRNDVRKVSVANFVCSTVVLFLICRLSDLFEIARNVSSISQAYDSGNQLLRCENVSLNEARDCKSNELECAILFGLSQRDAWMLVQGYNTRL